VKLILRAGIDIAVVVGLLLLLDPGTFAGRVWLAFGALVVVAVLAVDWHLEGQR